MDSTVSFPQKWTPPRELARALPRETRITGRGIAAATMGVVLLAVAIPAGIWVRNQDTEQNARNIVLRSQGREATGQISHLWHKGRADTPMVSYAFGADGVWVQGESEVPEKVWPKIQKIGSLPIRYLPANPTVNHPAGWEEPAPPAWLAMAFPLLLAGCGGFLLWTIRRQATVAAEGAPAPGVITRCFRIKGGYRASYQFRTREGLVTKGSDKVTRRLDKGANVSILYLPQNPRRSKVYPLSMYRVIS